MAISNIFTHSKDTTLKIAPQTKEFGFEVLRTHYYMRKEKNENEEVVKNLVYASLILFYNCLLQQFKEAEKSLNTRGDREDAKITGGNNQMIQDLIQCLNDHIMDSFVKEHPIVNVVL